MKSAKYPTADLSPMISPASCRACPLEGRIITRNTVSFIRQSTWRHSRITHLHQAWLSIFTICLPLPPLVLFTCIKPDLSLSPSLSLTLSRRRSNGCYVISVVSSWRDAKRNRCLCNSGKFNQLINTNSCRNLPIFTLLILKFRSEFSISKGNLY